MNNTTKQIVARLALTAAPNDAKALLQQVIDAATELYGKPVQTGKYKGEQAAVFELKDAKDASYVNVTMSKTGVYVLLQQHYVMAMIDVASASGSTAEDLKAALAKPKHERNYDAATDAEAIVAEMSKLAEHL